MPGSDDGEVVTQLFSFLEILTGYMEDFYNAVTFQFSFCSSYVVCECTSCLNLGTGLR